MAIDRPLIEIRYDQAKLAKIERLLRDFPNALNRIMPRAVNRTATSARAELVRRLYDKLNLTKKRIRQYTYIKKAMSKYWQATVNLSAQRIKLIYFGARTLKGKGVSYQIERGGARKRIIEPPRSAFIQTMPRSGHVGVFKRKFPYEGGNILSRAIMELKGPSIGKAFEGAPGMVAAAERWAAGLLEKNIDDQVRFVLGKWLAASKGAA